MTGARHWYHQGISIPFLRGFWRALWGSWRPRRITLFMWLLAHKGLPVGSWLALMGQNGECQSYMSHRSETPKHFLLECPQARRVWQYALRIIAHTNPGLGYITWGAFYWLST